MYFLEQNYENNLIILAFFYAYSDYLFFFTYIFLPLGQAYHFFVPNKRVPSVI